MRMKNKKGQLGQIITSFPVMIFLVVLMTIFFFVSSAIAVFKTGPNYEAGNILNVKIDFNVMLEKVRLNIKEEEKEMSLFEAIAALNKDTLFLKIPKDIALQLIEGKPNHCFVMVPNNFFRTDNVGEYKYDESIIAELGEYYDANLMNKIYFVNGDGKKVFVEYYIGECLK